MQKKYKYKTVQEVTNLFLILFRNITSNGQTTVTKVRSVSDFGTPYRSVAYGTETGRRNSATEVRNKPDTWCTGPYGGCLSG